jgi:hypothetical protein
MQPAAPTSRSNPRPLGAFRYRALRPTKSGVESSADAASSERAICGIAIKRDPS